MSIIAAILICAGFGLLFGLTRFRFVPYALTQMPLVVGVAYVTRGEGFLTQVVTVVGSLSVGQIAYVISLLILAPLLRLSGKAVD
jgi:hypothetical protein